MSAGSLDSSQGTQLESGAAAARQATKVEHSESRLPFQNLNLKVRTTGPQAAQVKGVICFIVLILNSVY
jgi:hypothetical protein